MPFIHPSAFVDEGAQVGRGTRVWHFCHLMPTAVVGEDCMLGQNVFVGNNVRIGNRVKIQNNVSLYSGLVCEDEVFIGPSAVFTNVINPRSAVERKAEFQPTTLHKGVSIGANATIVCGVELGEYAFVGAGAVVTKSVPAYGLVIGVPAQQIGWMSRRGQRLFFDEKGEATCEESAEKYLLSNGTVALIEP